MSMFSRTAPGPDRNSADSRPVANALPELKTVPRHGPATLAGTEPLPSAGMPAQNAPGTANPKGRGESVIGPDLIISGSGLRIVSNGLLRVDGQVQGDVQGSEVIVGESGRIDGVIAADRVVVKGKVAGEIRARDVVLDTTCQMDGDVHHNKLTIALGAHFEGRSRRSATEIVPSLPQSA